MIHDTYTSIHIPHTTYLHPSQRKQMDLILLQFLYPWMTVYLYLSCQVYISSISAYLTSVMHTCILDKTSPSPHMVIRLQQTRISTLDRRFTNPHESVFTSVFVYQ